MIIYAYIINKSFKGRRNFGEIFTIVTAVKIVVTSLIFYFAWMHPLSELGKLRIPDQLGGGFIDANYYDYLGFELAGSSFKDAQDYLFATWLSFGVVFYNGLIYYLFGGQAVNILIINIIMSSAVDYLIFKLLFKKVKHILFFLIPLFLYVIFYTISPGKEAISNLFFFLSIYITYDIISNNKRSFINYFIKAFALIVLCCMRINLAFLICLIDFYIIFSYAKSHRKYFISSIIIILSLLLFFVIKLYSLEVLASILDVDKYLSNQYQYLSTKSGLTFYIADLLMPTSVVLYLLLAPIRAIAWLIGPFPALDFSIFSCIYDECSFYSIFSRSESFFRSLSGFMNSIFLFFIFKNWGKFKSVEVQKIWDIFFPALIISTLIISTLTFLEGARYRVIIEPILFILFCISFKTRMNI
jgi:hypothetical protein